MVLDVMQQLYPRFRVDWRVFGEWRTHVIHSDAFDAYESAKFWYGLYVARGVRVVREDESTEGLLFEWLVPDNYRPGYFEIQEQRRIYGIYGGRGHRA